jgi:hypothetical protein
MSVAIRLAHLERHRFAEACAAFRPWFLARIYDPAVLARDRAIMVEHGAPADATDDELVAWSQARRMADGDVSFRDIEAVVDLLMEHPTEHGQIRAALATVARHYGHDRHDPPLAILGALRVAFATK